MPALLGDEWSEEQARQVMLFEEFIAARLAPEGGGFALPLAPLRQKSALLHGHCHQKAFSAVAPVQEEGHRIARMPAAFGRRVDDAVRGRGEDVRSEEHTSELQSLMRISYAVFCLKKKKPIHTNE